MQEHSLERLQTRHCRHSIRNNLGPNVSKFVHSEAVFVSNANIAAQRPNDQPNARNSSFNSKDSLERLEMGMAAEAATDGSNLGLPKVTIV